MLGPAQMKWLKKTLKEPAIFTVFCTNVPVTPKVKPVPRTLGTGSTVNAKRSLILSPRKDPGVVILSADRHRSDAYKIDTGIEGMYPSTSANPPG